ncbi:hypothetical protein RirG_194880 [Rhizophagus irregularis DAOM 197198w]|uniref:BTB domain-containing protein n=1 Tax=Rhizophagus irregularis (strain DAOM 197198w) TaxID=1432141 RepID=A0A015KGM8_RHIIW|nr:hypothetical protein RirG_194880 [Rhizophagus irregularis DAOM 197198w]
MTLAKDLEILINNPKFSDIEIFCENEKKLYGCRAILAVRSNVFYKLLYNGRYESQISFPNISSFGMEIVFEYIYTGSIKEESLTKGNILEAFYAADYFQLSGIQRIIIVKTYKDTLEKSCNENYSPEILSKLAETIPLTDDNIFLSSLVDAMAVIPLNTIEFGRLSIKGLRYFLSCTEKPFTTPEYEVFRYSAILAAKQVSDDAYKFFMERLPTLEQIEQNENLLQPEIKFITDHQKVAKELEPLTEFIDCRRIKGCTSSLVGESARAKKALENNDIFEWDVIIEKACNDSWVRVCTSENFNYEIWAGCE